MSNDQIHLSLHVDELVSFSIVIAGLRGYTIGMKRFQQGTEEEQLFAAADRFLEKIGFACNDALSSVQHDPKSLKLKEQFNSELIQAITGAENAGEIPSRITETLEKYDIIRRKSDPDPSDDIPF